MRKTTSVPLGLNSIATIFIFFSFIVVGCNKEHQNSINHEYLINEYKLALFKDKDFINNYMLDLCITSLNRKKNLVIDDHKTTQLFESLKIIKSKQELTYAWKIRSR